ncbi:unnamed protein product [Leptidea sinapis]|nr:unnamed protein product [Leptidea sinapis]
MKFIWLITVIVAVFFWPLATAEKDCYKHCSLVLKPVCATNGNTYSSLCFDVSLSIKTLRKLQLYYFNIVL